MLNKTSESAVQALLLIALDPTGAPQAPAKMAQRLGLSPTYLAKITQMLVRADILDSYKGAKGGVALARTPTAINLLEVVEACQGVTLRNYCREVEGDQITCSYHRAMMELRQAIRNTLANWTLADLLGRPASSITSDPSRMCVMAQLASVGPS